MSESRLPAEARRLGAWRTRKNSCLKMTIAQLNAADRVTFVATIGFVFEGSPWIAEAAWEQRPFADVDALHRAMLALLEDSPLDRRIAVIAAHPDLAGRLAREGRLTHASRSEQISAGLDRLTPEQSARFERLNVEYHRRFGFPFVVCVRENTEESLLAALAARTQNDRTTEISSALVEIGKIARLRLLDCVTPS